MSTSAITVLDSATLSTPRSEDAAIAMCDRAKEYLDRAKSTWGADGLRAAKRVEDVADMLVRWAAKERASDDVKTKAGLLASEALRTIGELEKRLDSFTAKEASDVATQKRRDPSGTAVVPGKTPKKEVLAQAGIDKRKSQDARKAAAIPLDQYEAWKASDQEKSKAGLLRLASGGKLAAFSSESVEWYTPPEYIEAARKALGGTIDLDPASCAKANEAVQARRFFTREDDALKKKWKAEGVWLNPPYADDGTTGTGDWATKMVEEFRAGHFKSGVLLVNAVTDRKWFRQLFDYAICFTDHRIEFYTPSGQPKSPISGNAFIYFGGARKRFAAAFAPFGATVEAVS
jgi:phage N-6-adenine-methyltransferase